jgi:hypothetical protein
MKLKDLACSSSSEDEPFGPSRRGRPLEQMTGSRERSTSRLKDIANDLLEDEAVLPSLTRPAILLLRERQASVHAIANLVFQAQLRCVSKVWRHMYMQPFTAKTRQLRSRIRLLESEVIRTKGCYDILLIINRILIRNFSFIKR